MQNKDNFVTSLVKYKYKEYLSTAAKSGKLGSICLSHCIDLIEAGADPKTIDPETGKNILHQFCSNHQLFYKLVSLGCDINHEDNEGLTPIMYAMANGNIDLVKYYLDKY